MYEDYLSGADTQTKTVPTGHTQPS